MQVLGMLASTGRSIASPVEMIYVARHLDVRQDEVVSQFRPVGGRAWPSRLVEVIVLGLTGGPRQGHICRLTPSIGAHCLTMVLVAH
jgi:hypothetical protein